MSGKHRPALAARSQSTPPSLRENACHQHCRRRPVSVNLGTRRGYLPRSPPRLEGTRKVAQGGLQCPLAARCVASDTPPLESDRLVRLHRCRNINSVSMGMLGTCRPRPEANASGGGRGGKRYSRNGMWGEMNFEWPMEMKEHFFGPGCVIALAMLSSRDCPESLCLEECACLMKRRRMMSRRPCLRDFKLQGDEASDDGVLIQIEDGRVCVVTAWSRSMLQRSPRRI